MRTLYAAQFDIGEPRATLDTPPFEALHEIATRWIRAKYLRAWRTTLPDGLDGRVQMPLAGHSLSIQTRREGQAAETVVDWQHPDDKDDSLRWAICLCWAQQDARIQWRVSLGLDTARDVLRPARFLLGRPSIVGDVLHCFRCKFGGWPVPWAVQTADVAGVLQIVQGELLNPRRTLPVIVVSPDAQSEWCLPNPKQLFDSTQGMCHVVVLKDKWAAYKLTECLGHRPLSCFDGGVRIYWPGFLTSDTPRQHPLLLKSTISRWMQSDEAAVANHMFRLLSSVGVLRQREGEVLRSVRTHFAAVEGRRIGELHKAIATETDKSKRLGSDLGAAEELNKLLQELNGTLESKLKVVQGEKDALLAERDELRRELALQREQWATVHQFQQSSPSEEDAEEEAPLSVYQTVLNAKENFKDNLVFLDSALESAQESPFQNPERVAELFEALDAVAGVWREKGGKLGQTWEQAIKDLGFDFREHISDTSRTKWGKEYQFLYKGQKLIFENHVTLGAKQADTCLSVHMYRDEQNLKLVIGHCGRHLTNTKT